MSNNFQNEEDKTAFLRPILEMRTAHLYAGGDPPPKVYLGHKERMEMRRLGMFVGPPVSPEIPLISTMQVEWVDRETYISLEAPKE